MEHVEREEILRVQRDGGARRFWNCRGLFFFIFFLVPFMFVGGVLHQSLGLKVKRSRFGIL